MKIDLFRRRDQSLFCAVIFLLGGSLAFLGAKAWLAERWNASSNPILWRKAAQLEPGDAQYWRHLGLYKQWRVGEGGIREAIGNLERATQTDPRSATLWMDLADAYQSSGERVRAQQAYEKAQADYPMSAEVAWRYGSFLLYHGNVPAGYAEIKRALLVDPSLAASAIAECWQTWTSRHRSPQRKFSPSQFPD